MDREDTIAAIATGMTDSGIGILRISGKRAGEIGDGMFRSPAGKRLLRRAESHRMYYGSVVDGEDMIDEAMAVSMYAPRSFTGEDVVELHCHGGTVVMRRVLETALKAGARLAEPGEFTKRAFLNGRVDLAEAEAVMDVIASQSERALALSLRQLKGGLSREIRRLREEILYEVARIESAIDDPEHFTMEGYQEELAGKLGNLLRDIRRLADTAHNGRLWKEGIRTAILGKPNVGKSSFLNCLLGEERAIVTDVAGTTRDLLEEPLRLGEMVLNLVDTAGIRETSDTVERIGVEKAMACAGEADLVVYVADGSAELDEDDRRIISLIGDKRVIVLLNKDDLGRSRVSEEEIETLFGENHNADKAFPWKKPRILRTSLLKGEGLDRFGETVREMFFQGEIGSSPEIVITNLRHKESLEEAYASLKLVEKSVGDGMPEDFYSIDLMSAYASLGRIIGEEVEDNLVEEIFSKFCLGK